MVSVSHFRLHAALSLCLCVGKTVLWPHWFTRGSLAGETVFFLLCVLAPCAWVCSGSLICALDPRVCFCSSTVLFLSLALSRRLKAGRVAPPALLGFFGRARSFSPAGLLIVVASLLRSSGSRCSGFSTCGAGSVGPLHLVSSQDRDRTCVPCTASQSLKAGPPEEPSCFLLFFRIVLAILGLLMVPYKF